MSHDNLFSSAHWQSSLASSSSNRNSDNTANQQDRSAQSPWGPSSNPSQTRHGLTPLSTSDLGAVGRPSSHQAQADINNAAALPSNANFPPLAPASSSRFAPRRPTPPTSSHSNSPIYNLQSGASQQSGPFSGRSITSPRSRTITPLQNAVTGATASAYSGPGAGGGGGSGYNTGLRSGAYSPSFAGQAITSPTASNFERSPSISSNPGSATGAQSSFSKISATQVLLLVDTITDRKGQAEWEAKAEKIRKLLDSNGMEVFTQFFRRAVSSNAPVIFQGARDGDQGSYRLLQQEMEKVFQDPDQTSRIAEAIDASRDDVFRDFNLSAFIAHFYTDPFAQLLLAVAFTRCTRTDLRNKADAVIASAQADTLQQIGAGRLALTKYHPRNMAAILEYLAFSVPLAAHNSRIEFFRFMTGMYKDKMAPEVSSALMLVRVPSDNTKLVKALMRGGSKSTSSKQAVEDILHAIGLNNIDDDEMSHAILFMMLSRSQSYDLSTFITTVRTKTHHMRIDWAGVISNFTSLDLRIQREDYVRLVKALLPVAEEDPTCDIRKLWGGEWRYPQTQLSFLASFLYTPTSEISTKQIPDFQHGFSPKEVSELPEESRQFLEPRMDTPWCSLEAMIAILYVVFPLDAEESLEVRAKILSDLFDSHSEFFLLSLQKLKVKPWSQEQEAFVHSCFRQYLSQSRDDYAVVLKTLYAHSHQFLFDLCALTFQQDPTQTESIYQRAQEFDWMDEFLKHWSNPLSLDMACIKSKLEPTFDLEKYLSDIAEGHAAQFGVILCKYVRIKADDEYRVQREHSRPQSVPLTLSTVHTLLDRLEELSDDRDLVESAQTTCLQTYPRLMNYGGVVDSILERTSQERGNKLSENTDAQMSDLFGRMYRSELSIRDMVQEMSKLKTSQDPDKQDLFCCIVHGLFDEYVCYSEYPEDALMKTALLFGSIIKFKLLPRIPRDFGLHLIYNAVRDNMPETLMYRFGIEALLQISDQLPEWPGLCNLLLQIPTLEDEEIIRSAQHGMAKGQADADINGHGREHERNGEPADFLKEDNLQSSLRSIRAEAPPSHIRSREPDQQAQEKILFVINNLSKDNMSAKFSEVKNALTDENYQWFACYLVEQRAKLEPNNQDMYLEFALLMDDEFLMSEIVRETFVSVVKLINSESTLSSTTNTERTQLKNLGSWLGSLTLAQDKPIKHKNIYFVDFLIEGLESSRLLIVIPFTCKVLAQSAKSTVFKEHNPWLTEIAEVLKELYDDYDLKLSLKFEIEVLFNDHLKRNLKKMPNSHIVRDKLQAEEALATATGVTDGLDSFDDVSLGPIRRAGREQLSASQIMSTLPPLHEKLKYPPSTGSLQEQDMVKETVYRAFDQAIQEIIAPVVERSITIASIATQQLISKDYALEANPEHLLNGAKEMVKDLAGNLALVTCKEPLKMSITNWMRRPLDDSNESPLPEGAILMCVNDNIDTACYFVEQAAVQRSVEEIEHVLEQEIEERKKFAAEPTTNGFQSLLNQTNNWGRWIPPPYKQIPGGLNEEQRAVYEDFQLRVRGMNLGHIQNPSTDSTGRQIPDVLQDNLGIPNLSTPADSHAMPHQSPMASHDPRNLGNLPPRALNGQVDNIPPQQRISQLVEEVQQQTRLDKAVRLKDVEKNSIIFQHFRHVLIIVTSSTHPPPELLARHVAEKICTIFATSPPQVSLEAEWLAFLLSKLCQLSELIIRDVYRWMTMNETVLLVNANTAAALIMVGLFDFVRVDTALANIVATREIQGLQLLSDLMDQTLFGEEPLALRADFANTLVEMSKWLKDVPDLEQAREINQKLQERGMPEFVVTTISDEYNAKKAQMRYTFDEWLSMFENLDPDSESTAAFLKEMHKNQTINNTEDLSLFIRLATEICVESYEREASIMRGSIDTAFLPSDALAKLLISLVVYQGSTEGAVQLSKGPYLNSILSVLVLIFNHDQVTRGIAFHQRVFGRIVSSILYFYADSTLQSSADHDAFMGAFGNLLTSLQPAWFPGFNFAWLGLITHRVLVTGTLGRDNHESAMIYRDLIALSLSSLARMSSIPMPEGVVAEMYRGTMKNILVLHHDFQEFLCTNCTYLCGRVPFYMPQLRNLLLTSRPAECQDLPDPNTPGLEVERLERMKKDPELAPDFDKVLHDTGIAEIIDAAFAKGGRVEDAVASIAATLQDDTPATTALPLRSIEVLTVLVPYVAVRAVAASTVPNDSTPQTQLLNELVNAFSSEQRFYLINAFFDQIRYPNTHTNFFCKFILALWSRKSGNDEIEAEIKDQIARVASERLGVARPHPWGLTILGQELMHNPRYGFWDYVDKSDGAALAARLQNAVRSVGAFDNGNGNGNVQ